LPKLLGQFFEFAGFFTEDIIFFVNKFLSYGF